MTTRCYVLSMTKVGCGQDEFDSEAARDEFLEQQDNTFDDYYCLDVNSKGEIDFWLADCGATGS